ncbi:tripartite tricarboxylate transporter permease [Halobellus ruber]|uniref:Tripartite tricarboxylate transporter permease n=1 Tax=Halobellus ruber TaxID=2761102 RepID=A0A7J9SJK3_9EURY|nr:tripartite tricarboxylate transporter permease [Halobellus ruber]MBB6645191.1 tripartite tricarboxylate transporter permease [Halobellus ruber]
MASPLAVVGYACLGVGLGTVTGLVPGLHVNSVAFILVGIAPGLDGPAAAVAAAILAAGVVHTFLSIVPGLVLGVPEAATAPGALPGHRLVLAGRGREAIRLSALGSGIALAGSVAVALPLSRLVAAGREWLLAALPVLLAAIAGLLILAEPTRRGKVGGAVCLAVATGLGLLALDLPASGPLSPEGAASMLAPIFGGLFGAPILLDALDARGAIPPQDGTGLGLSPLGVARAALSGVAGGTLVGYLPGVSAGVAAVLALGGAGGSGPAGEGSDRAYVVATSGADTATAVFAVASLAVLGAPRSGVTVAVAELGGGSGPGAASAPGIGLAGMLLVVVFAAGLGICLLVTVGDRYLSVVRRLPRRPLVAGVFGLLFALSVGFAGILGGAVFCIAAVVGLVPPRVGARRVHLMGVLIGPVALG